MALRCRWSQAMVKQTAPLLLESLTGVYASVRSGQNSRPNVHWNTHTHLSPLILDSASHKTFIATCQVLRLRSPICNRRSPAATSVPVTCKCALMLYHVTGRLCSSPYPPLIMSESKYPVQPFSNQGAVSLKLFTRCNMINQPASCVKHGRVPYQPFVA